MNHRELYYINLPFYFSDWNSDSIDLIATSLDLSTDFNLEHLFNPYRKRIKSYIINIVYKTKDKKVQLVNKTDEKDEKLKRRRD